MSNLRTPRVPGGSVGQQVSLGGVSDSSGNPAGNVVISGKARTYVQMNEQGGADPISHMQFRTASGLDHEGLTELDVLGLYYVVNPDDAADARDKIHSGLARYMNAGETRIVGAGGVNVSSIVVVALANLENYSAPNIVVGTNTYICGTIKRAATASTAANVATVMLTLVPVTPIKSVEITLSASHAQAHSTFKKQIVAEFRGVV